MDERLAVTGLVLAGGRGSRMGGRDKGLVALGGRPLIAHVIEGLRPQVATILVNANRHAEDYAHYGYPVVADRLGGHPGPLAGLASGLYHAATPWVASVPCDCPFLPGDLVARLQAALQGERAEIAVAHDGRRLQPVFALVPCRLLASLLGFLAEGDRKASLWYGRHKTAVADFSDVPEAFVNLNTPEDLAALEAASGRIGPR